MNTETREPEETLETIEPISSDVLTEDGVITPTQSRTKANWFDHSTSWAVVAVVLIVMFVGGVAIAFNMGATQRQEVTSTTYNHAGQCLKVQSFRIRGNTSGENPDLFAKYQAEHPDETPEESKINHGCPIPIENNSKR